MARRWWEPRRIARWRLRRGLGQVASAGFRMLFIAGCARSGTTLLRSLMPCFDGSVVCPVERGLEAFWELARSIPPRGRPTPTLVVKRTHRFHRELHRLPACIDLVYCVRDPGDCLTSRHEASAATRPFHVTIPRWRAEFEALLRLERRQPGRRITIVRYEDLVTHPDRVQADLADRLGLVVAGRFSSNGLGITIHDRSVGRSRRDPALLAAALQASCGKRPVGGPAARGLGAFCRRFGYDAGWIGPPDGTRPPRR